MLPGRRRSRFAACLVIHRFTVVPDWVCGILSPSTESKDRKVKMPINAQCGVPCAWLLDPVAHSLEAYALEGGAWQEIGRFAGAAPVSVAPFEAVTIRLDDLWAPIE
nr:Uma2 family endonuclease [Lamprocystis purpurea]